MKARNAMRYLCCALIGGVLGLGFGGISYLFFWLMFLDNMVASWATMIFRYGAWGFLICSLGPLIKTFREWPFPAALAAAGVPFCLSGVSGLLLRMGSNEFYGQAILAVFIFQSGYIFGQLLRGPFECCADILEERQP